MEGEVANQVAYFPGLLPKVPGRFYYLFGKPIDTAGIFLICYVKVLFSDLMLGGLFI